MLFMLHKIIICLKQVHFEIVPISGNLTYLMKKTPLKVLGIFPKSPVTIKNLEYYAFLKLSVNAIQNAQYYHMS